MIQRKIGAILRGKATPFQIVSACVLGAALGFAPPFAQAPALGVLLVGLLLVVNANLGLALLVAAGSRLLSLALLPISFELGRLLIEGPLGGLVHTIANAPFFAWCGLQYYAVLGGELIAVVLGCGTGLLAAFSVASYRRRMLAAEAHPAKWKELLAKPWARFMIWLFFGGKGKIGWDQKLQKKIGNPVRVTGAVVLVLAGVGAYLGQNTIAGPLAKHYLKGSLESSNGATADVGSVELDLAAGRFVVTELALADPKALETNAFEAARLEADLDQADLLRGRMHLSRVVVSEAKSGAQRATPGERYTPPKPEVSAPQDESSDPSVIDLESIVKEYETWKGRLATAQDWLERLSGDGDEAAADGAARDETLAERLEREARERGWLAIEAEGVREDAPALRLSELVLEGFSFELFPGQVFDGQGQELSTAPGLVDAAPKVALTSRDGSIAFSLDLAPISRGGGEGGLAFAWKGLSVDACMAQLNLGGTSPLRGGTLDLVLDGAWADGKIGVLDLPLRVRLHDTVLALEGYDELPLDQLELGIGIQGSLGSPRFRFERSELVDALVAAGKKEFANQVKQRLNDEVGQGLGILKDRVREELPEGLEEKLGDKLGEVPAVDEAKKALGGWLDKKKKGGGPN